MIPIASLLTNNEELFKPGNLLCMIEESSDEQLLNFLKNMSRKTKSEGSNLKQLAPGIRNHLREMLELIAKNQ